MKENTMNNIKNVIFYTFITFSMQVFCGGKEHMFERASKNLGGGMVDSSKIISNAITNGAQKAGVESAKVLAGAGIESTRIVSNAAVEASQKIGVDAVKVVAEASKDISKDLADGMVKSSATIGSEAVQKLVPVAQAAVCVLAVKEAVVIGKDIYTYAYPDQEKIARLKDAEERISVIDTKRAFRSCLMKNAKGQRNKTGIPVSCEECGQSFAMTAGLAAFRDMVETFKETY
jgi:hypothetical protein